MPGFDLSSCEALLLDVDQQIRQMERLLASRKVRVRPSEMIAGSSASQPSCGDVTDETIPLGVDFSAAARIGAEINIRPDENPCVPSGNTNPMQSVNLGSGDFAARYGVGFLCSSYPPGSKLPTLSEVEGYSQPNGEYRRAFAGLSEVEHCTNLAKAAILGKLRERIDRAGRAAPPSRQVELVVSFQGHGLNGGFYASDAALISPAEMVALAGEAEKVRVSLTYVLDACFAGGAVPEFQEHATEVVAARLGADAPAGARDLLLHVRALIQFNRAITPLAGLMGDHLQRRKTAKVMVERAKVLEMLRAMHPQVQINMLPNPLASSLGREVDLAFQRALHHLALDPDPSDPWFTHDYYTNELGIFQDRLSDLTNQLLQAVQAQVP